jgi:hypothetical protein
VSDALFTAWIECDGGCGSKVEVTSLHEKSNDKYVEICVEALGWKGIGKGKKKTFYCPGCIRRARVIVRETGAK